MNEMKIRRHTPHTEEECRTAAICIIELREENQSLKDNWNKLKEWLNNFHKLSEFEQWEIVNKMQEIEGGMNE